MGSEGAFGGVGGQAASGQLAFTFGNWFAWTATGIALPVKDSRGSMPSAADHTLEELVEGALGDDICDHGALH